MEKDTFRPLLSAALPVVSAGVTLCVSAGTTFGATDGIPPFGVTFSLRSEASFVVLPGNVFGATNGVTSGAPTIGAPTIGAVAIGIGATVDLPACF